LRHFRLVVASVLFLLASSAPALAQTAGPDQYDVRGSQSLEDGIQNSTETAAVGTQAVSGALSGNASPAASDSPDEVAGLTELPETGGVSPVLPGAGALLVTSGLLVRRMFR